MDCELSATVQEAGYGGGVQEVCVVDVVIKWQRGGRC